MRRTQRILGEMKANSAMMQNPLSSTVPHAKRGPEPAGCKGLSVGVGVGEEHGGQGGSVGGVPGGQEGRRAAWSARGRLQVEGSP